MTEGDKPANAPAPQTAFLVTAWAGIGSLAFTYLSFVGADAILFVCTAVIWLSWGCAAQLVERADIRERETAKSQDAPKRYYDRVGKLLTRLETLLLPETVAANPRPSGWSDRFDWALTPLARDAEDLKRLFRNPFSWPVHDFALRVAIAYPLLFVVAQFLLTRDAVTMAGYDLVPAETSYGWTLATFGLVASALMARILATATSQGIFEKLAMWLFFVAFAGAFAGAFAVAALTFALGRRGHLWGQGAYLVIHAAAFGVGLVAAIQIPADNPFAI